MSSSRADNLDERGKTFEEKTTEGVAESGVALLDKSLQVIPGTEPSAVARVATVC